VSVTIRAPLQLVPFAVGESARERKSSSRFSNDGEPARIPSITRNCSRAANGRRSTDGSRGREREREREQGGRAAREGAENRDSDINDSRIEHFELVISRLCSWAKILRNAF
jgi:hypothetical protein